MNSDIRSFFTKKKVQIRYASNSLSEKRKERKEKIQKGPKQATIESLGRVIVIEEFERCKGVLTEDNASKERIVEALKSLGSKTPSRSILKKTNLGLIINGFRKHEDSEIAELAKKTYRKWKIFIRNHENLKPIEVRSDKKTEELRGKAKEMLIGVFTSHMLDETVDEEMSGQLTENATEYGNALEREVLKLNKRLISKPYRRHMRRLTLKLRKDHNLVEAIIAGEKDPGEVAEETHESNTNVEAVGRLLYNENKLDPDLK